MGGKAKFQKHSAKEINSKIASHKNKGGGKEGAAQRVSGGSRLAFICDICKSSSPDIKTFELHYTSKHPKAPFDKAAIEAKAKEKSEAAKAAAGATNKKQQKKKK